MATVYCTCATAWSSMARQATEMRKVWQGIVRTIFWSHERMTWQYDVMVILIVLFVMLTPRSWFHDQPQSYASAHGVITLVSQSSDAQTRTYRVEATALPPGKRAVKVTPELERLTHGVLGGSVGSLNGHTFQVVRVDPVLARDGSVQYYDVTVHL